MVSQVELKQSGDALAVEVHKADGAKCERCWKYTTDVGVAADFPTACLACAEAVREQA